MPETCRALLIIKIMNLLYLVGFIYDLYIYPIKPQVYILNLCLYWCKKENFISILY
jgi:hypothetical protein